MDDIMDYNIMVITVILYNIKWDYNIMAITVILYHIIWIISIHGILLMALL